MTDRHHLAQRFAGIRRLYEPEGFARIKAAHVAIIGIGGVGSWTAEALARSGIGALTLIDADEVCVSNVNRQLHALDGTIGKPKVDVLGDRLAAIHPACTIHRVGQFVSRANIQSLLAGSFDAVVDAIDGVTMKSEIIAACRDRGFPVVTCGAAGGKSDPTKVALSDISEACNDRLLMYVRKKLRKNFGFPRAPRKMKVPAVYSSELPRWPEGTAACHPGDGADPLSEPTRMNCEGGLGAATFVTGTFGFVAAAWVTNRLAAGP